MGIILLSLQKDLSSLVLIFKFLPGVAIRPQEKAIRCSGHNWEEGEHDDQQKPELLPLVSLVSSTRPLDLRVFLTSVCKTSSLNCVVFPEKEKHCTPCSFIVIQGLAAVIYQDDDR